MADLRSELRGAFQRRLDAAPMRPDLVARAAQRAAEPRPPRQPLALATALAVLLMVAVVATLLYVTTSQRSRSTPANHSTPAVSPSLIPSSAPLEATYGTKFAHSPPSVMLQTLTTAPLRRARIAGASACTRANAACAFTRWMRSYHSE